MKKNNLKHLIAILAIFGFSSYGAYAQDTNERSSKFMYEVGFGKGYTLGEQNLSPWGVHYRGNYDGGFYLQLQGNYIKKNCFFYGLKVDMFITAGNYEIENNQRVAENIFLAYFAPQMGFIRSISPRVSIVTNAGVGYSLYESNGLLENTEYRINSHLFGVNTDFSVDYLLAKKLTIGCKTSLFAAYSEKLHREIGGVKDKITTNKWNAIAPCRFDFSVFLRRYF